MGFFRKPFVYAGLFTLCLLAFTAYALLDVFVIPHPLSAVSPDASQKETGETAASPAESGETSEGNPTAAAVITEDSYTDTAVTMNWPVAIAAIVFCAVIGVLFGGYPAAKRRQPEDRAGP